MTGNVTNPLYRAYVVIAGIAAAVALVGAAFAAWAADTSTAAPTVEPTNTTEPRITGTTRVGQILRTTRGSWTGTEPITFAYRWYRCDGRGAPRPCSC